MRPETETIWTNARIRTMDPARPLARAMLVRDGRIVKVVRGNTHVVKPEFDIGIEKKIRPYFERFHSVRMNNFKISDDELCECGGGSKLIAHACRKRG